MPYIKQEQREGLDSNIETLAYKIRDVGELNYVISSLAGRIAKRQPRFNYAMLSSIRAEITDAADEFYRRVMAPYEDNKRQQNGDVY